MSDHNHPAGVPTVTMADTPILAEVRRCAVTKNPVGSDTWAAGHTCRCAECRAYVAEQEVARLRAEVAKLERDAGQLWREADQVEDDGR